MIAATLFSGIGAPEMAMPHWCWGWHAEIELAPAAVLAVRHPHSMNLGDVTADDFCERATAIAKPTVLVFGSPCQSFSVAGKRLGLDDPRGNLALVALGILARLEPRWFVFENVPGLLSSADGCDFGLFLRAVDELGYSLCWTVLDAQYFGVAQRRERVFAVGYLGDWRYPAAVLFEPEGLCGHSSPRHQTRQEVAGTIGAGSERCGQRVGHREAATNQLVAFGIDSDCIDRSGEGADCSAGARSGLGIQEELSSALRSKRPNAGAAFGGNNTSGPVKVAATLQAHAGPAGRMDFASETFVTHALRADGFDASEDGTGRGTPLVAFDTTQITSKTNRCQPQQGDPCHPLAAGAHPPAIAFDASQDPCSSSDLSRPLRNQHNGLSNGLMTGAAVRRLTPRECERLQGFPDDYTAIVHRGKPMADRPRYKMLGNSMAVPAIRWPLARIEALEQQRVVE